MEDLAKVAYDAYVRSCGGTAVNGDQLPEWEALPSQIQQHWDAASQAVLRAMTGGSDE